MIQLLIIGHLGQDATINQVNGKNVINFSIAHTEKFKNQQGALVSKTIWVGCSQWTTSTGIAAYLKKGKEVFVQGTPDVNVYSDRSGQPQAQIKLRVTSIQLLGGKQEGSGNPADVPQGGNWKPANEAGHPPGNQNPNDITEPVDDLPF